LSSFVPASGGGAVHVPVLLREVIAQLDLRPGLVVVDGTVGAGGHSREILNRIRPGGRLIGLDRDPMMLAHARPTLAGPDAELVHSSYRELRQVLDSMHIPAADRVLVDLGLSSDQLADRARGFGFDSGGPLDMRFDPTRGKPVSEWLKTVDEAELTRVLREYGEVPQAREIAAEIVRRRKSSPVETVEQLIDAIGAVTRRGGRGPIDKSLLAPVFQALRIVANEELEHLTTFLDDVLPQCVSPGGRVAIISFHSLEDRLLKQAFKSKDVWENLTKKPIEPTPSEVRVNPRSRSARLRVAVRKPDDSGQDRS
jgi:16S rRNA (cytosine1402-N4)-methyltransferase